VVDESIISGLLRGDRSPSLATANKLALELGVRRNDGDADRQLGNVAAAAARAPVGADREIRSTN
jgi:hypothetical protein